MRYVMVVMLVFACILELSLPAPGYCIREGERNSRELREDIQILNLLNGLELSRDQAAFIISKAREAQQLRDSAQQKMASAEAGLTDSYAAIKEQVQEGRVVIEKEDARHFHKIKTEAEGALRQAQARVEEIAAEVEGRLEPYQLAALDAYRPCVIPIVSQGRIGQASSSDGVCRLLERAQRMSSEIFQRRKNELAARAIGQLKNRRAVTGEEEAVLRFKVLEAFEEARRMDAADFALQKDLLADRLSQELLPKRHELSRSDKIKTFLLSGNVIPLLEERLSRQA
ncbi:MAG: hypothetical protein ACE14U_07450 [Candidatus Velamenicoccus archaeovorus]